MYNKFPKKQQAVIFSYYYLQYTTLGNKFIIST